jgi:hypothetical protein
MQTAATYDAAHLRSLGHEVTVLAIDREASIEAIEALWRLHRGKTVLSGGYQPSESKV